METPWRKIDSTEVAKLVSKQVCWPDSDLSHYIYCNTSLKLESGEPESGLGLRLLVSCCSAPCSHLEICLLDITEEVSMPLSLSHFNGYIDDGLQFRFSFHYDAFDSRCRRAFYRFIELDHAESHRLYLHPSVLHSCEGPLSRDGYAESRTADGGHIILTGGDSDPLLNVTDPKGQECEVRIDPTSAQCIVEALHPRIFK